MPRTCSVCTHSAHEAIDQVLVAGQSYRDIAGRFGTTKSALARHKDGHLPATLIQSTKAVEVARADTLLDQVKALQGKALDILTQAEACGDFRAATSATREAPQTMELVGKMAGELDERSNVNVAVLHPRWSAEQMKRDSDDLCAQLRVMAERSFATHKRIETPTGSVCTSCLCLDDGQRARATVASQMAVLERIS